MHLQKFLFFIAAVLTTFCAKAFTVDGINYSASGGVATVTGASSKSVTKVVIPATVTYGSTTYPVKYIKYNAFNNYASLKELVIEDSDTYIGSPLYTNSQGWQTLGTPFAGCPIERIYLGRNNFFGSTSSIQADYLILSSTAGKVDLTIAGGATYVISGQMKAFPSNLNSVTIGGSVTTVMKGAFKDCTTLKKLTFDTKSSSINFANECFAGCALDSLVLYNKVRPLTIPEVNNIVIKNTVSELSDRILADDLSIKSLVIEDGNNELGISDRAYPFSYLTIDNFHWGRSVTNDLRYFFGESKIKNLTIGENLTTVPQKALDGHTELETVSLSSQTTTIGSEAFSGCSSLTKISLPESLTELGSRAFYWCYSLSEIELPSKLTSIGEGAFEKTAITAISIPASVTTMGPSIFDGCSQLKNVVFEDGPEIISFTVNRGIFGSYEVDSFHYGRNVSDPKSFMYNIKPVNVTFGQYVTDIPQEALYLQSKLQTVSLSDRTKSIGANAFNGCSSLTKINLPESLTELGSRAFYWCYSLSEIELPSKLTSIGGGAFERTAITAITIPASVTTMGMSIFDGCSQLKNVVFEDGPEIITFTGDRGIFGSYEVDNFYYGRNVSDPKSFMYNIKPVNVTFGQYVTDIPQEALYLQSKLQTVSLSDRTKSIGANAFNGCSSLTKINLPESLTELGSRAFYWCDSLSEIELPSKLTSIGGGAFERTAITAISIPASVTTMGPSIFDGCSQLKNVIFEDGPEIISFTVNHGIFGSYVVDNFHYGRNVSDPKSFMFNIKPVNVTFGQYVTDIPQEALYLQPKLQTVTLSDKTKTIGKDAFAGCYNIETVNTFAQEPPTMANIGAFTSDVYSKATLNVPGGTRSKYREAEGWKLFDKISSMGTGLTVSVSYDSTLGTVLLNGEDVSTLELEEDDTVTITINPAECAELRSVLINGVDESSKLTDNTITIAQVTENLNIEVVFALKQFDITISSPTDGGHVEINGEPTSKIMLDYGSTVEIRPIADRGYELVKLTVNDEDVATSLNNGVFLIESIDTALRIEASFEKIKLSVTQECSSEYGSIILEGVSGDGTVPFGSDVTVIVNPKNPGCHITSLKINGVEVVDQVVNNRYVINAIEENTLVSADFNIDCFNISLIYDEAKGQINVDHGVDNGNLISVEYGSSLSLRFIPNDGYELESVLLDGNDVTDDLDNGILVLSDISSNHTISAQFVIRKVRLTIYGIEGGQVSFRYNYGDNVSVSVDSEPGWELHSFTVNGEIHTELDKNTFEVDGITEDLEITVVFKKSESRAETISSSESIVVGASGRAIVIRNANGETSRIFDTNGKMVYSGSDSRIEMDSPGVYIVTIASQSYKVLVR